MKILSSFSLMICNHGTSFPSVFKCEEDGSPPKDWKWIKYVPPMNPWDDLGEYRDTIKEYLSEEILKRTVKNKPTVNDETHVGSQDCTDAQELHWDSP